MSRFFRIVIAMYYGDHAPPHFHARYAGHDVTVRISDGLVSGEFPPRPWARCSNGTFNIKKSWLRIGSQHAITSRSEISIRWNEPMIPKLESVEYVTRYTIRVRFSDGLEGDVNLEDELWGEVFEPLKNLAVFRDLHLDTEFNTVRWPSGADLAPEFLHEKAAQRSESRSATRRH